MKGFIVILFLFSSALLYAQDTLGYNYDKRLPEISGIDPSVHHPGHFWVHNDSGGKPELYLVDSQMTIIMTVRLRNAIRSRTKRNGKNIDKTLNVRHIDWEDITGMYCDGKYYLVAGDIGDNLAIRRNIDLYRIVEPVFDDDTVISVDGDMMTLKYAEGARDAEALMYDPHSEKMIIVTKREQNVFVYNFNFNPIKMKIAASGRLDMTYVTAGDINDNGDILVKTYDKVWCFQSDGRNAVALLLEGSPQQLDYQVEKQGEAICWDKEGNLYFTISENPDGIPQPLYRYSGK